MVTVAVHESSAPPLREQELEIVERKGKGHPDTICDAIADRISVELSRAYTEACGRILHHNVDKGMLVAGQVECRLGGGRVLEPMRLIIGDRATMTVGRRRLPVARIAVSAARDWIGRNLRHVDPQRHVRYQVELKPASAELEAIFASPAGLHVANDTSAAVGYAPLTPTEQVVLELEKFLNGEFKAAFPETGEDVKVMAVREARTLSLTVAMPLLARAIRSEAAYFRRKAEILKAIERYVGRASQRFRRIEVSLNPLDRRGAGLEGMYLTLLGTSAEQGDSGEVGRGNRVSGVIALHRPMSVEAAAGKNPVSHVGKIYNVLAHDLAGRIHRQVGGVSEVTVWLCSRIGQRIDRPAVASAQIVLAPGASFPPVRRAAEGVIQEGLAKIGAFCEDLARGVYPVC